MSVICWDFDGTIAYTDAIWSRCVYDALLAVDAQSCVRYEDIVQCMASGFPWHTPEADHSAVAGTQWWPHMNEHFYKSYVNCGVPADHARAAAAQVRARIKQKAHYRLYDDTQTALRASLAKHHHNVILSNNFPDLNEVSDAIGLTPFFEHCIVSGQIGFEKPRMEIFQAAKSLYPQETRFVMIGDNPDADVAGAKRAGMETVLVHSGYDPRADYCFDTLVQVAAIL